MGTFLVGCAVLGCVAFAVRSIVGNKKKGKASCGGDCGSCKGCNFCLGGCQKAAALIDS